MSEVGTGWKPVPPGAVPPGAVRCGRARRPLLQYTTTGGCCRPVVRCRRWEVSRVCNPCGLGCADAVRVGGIDLAQRIADLIVPVRDVVDDGGILRPHLADHSATGPLSNPNKPTLWHLRCHSLASSSVFTSRPHSGHRPGPCTARKSYRQVGQALKQRLRTRAPRRARRRRTRMIRSNKTGNIGSAPAPGNAA